MEKSVKICNEEVERLISELQTLHNSKQITDDDYEYSIKSIHGFKSRFLNKEMWRLNRNGSLLLFRYASDYPFIICRKLGEYVHSDN